MIERKASVHLKKLAGYFRSIAIVGPRQSGKTTLAKSVFSDKPYKSFENPTERNLFLEDPKSYLNKFKISGAIFDEAQRVPEIFSYLQSIIDESEETGRFILTGSNNFLMQENITQTLAGRIAYLDLVPFSIEEIKNSYLSEKYSNCWQYIFYGSYPEPTVKGYNPIWFETYIRTYIERDVRQLKNIENLLAFEKLLHACAGRVGQILNVSALAMDIGVAVNTINSWLSLLESSYIIYLLKPHFKNFNKRITKSPKLYFYDTGLASHLLRIGSPEQLELTSSYKGHLFENFIINEMLKNRYNMGLRSNLYFWRDNTGHEVDVIIDEGETLHPIEIKSGTTVNTDYFKGLKFWEKLTSNPEGTVIYTGDEIQLRNNNNTKVLPWQKVTEL